LKVEGVEGWYHLYARFAGPLGEYPLADPVVSSKLLSIIEFYVAAYFFEVGSYIVMGSHYHLVARVDEVREVGRAELYERASMLYPGQVGQDFIASWNDEKWQQFADRLFNVSKLMSNIQSAFTRWYNRFIGRRGSFWAGRYSSSLLGDVRAAVDCMTYNELNAVRAGLVERPEDWRASSLHLREIGEAGWLLPLAEILAKDNEAEAVVDYRCRIYHRGLVPTKEGQAAIPMKIVEEEAARGFAVAGVFRKRLRYWVSGLIIGSESMVREHLVKLQESDYYRRRKNPIEQLGGLHFSLREQRSHASPL
jgi:hypothetical protein